MDQPLMTGDSSGLRHFHMYGKSSTPLSAIIFLIHEAAFLIDYNSFEA